jgi:hypothetical protein
MRRVPPFWIGFALVALARTLMALSRIDDLRGEELYQGSLAWAFVQGLPLDPTQLPVIVHLRGSVVFGLFAAPLYWAFGPSYIALKAVAVLWSGLAGGLLAMCAERAVGRRAAWGVTALAALFPPAYQMVDASAYGSHLDADVPMLAALALLVARRAPLGFARAGLLGLALGFGVFFSLQCVVAAPALVAAWWAADGRFWRRPASLGLLSALAPLACIPLVSSSSALVTKPMSEHVLPAGLAGAGAKLLAALKGDLVRAQLFEVSGGAWLGFVYAAAVVLALALLFPRLRAREPLAFFALLHPLSVLSAYALSDFELNLDVRLNGMGSRYLMPVMPALALALVLGRERLGRLSGGLLVAAPLAAGALGYLGLLDARPFLALPPRSGTNFAFFEPHLVHAAADPAGRIAWARRVDPDWDAYRPLTCPFLVDAEAQGPIGPAAWKRVAALAPAEKPYALVGLGLRSLGNSRPETLATGLAAPPAGVSAEDARWFRLGQGRALFELGFVRGMKSGDFAAPYRVLAALPAAGREDMLVGAGFQFGRLFTPYHDVFRATLVTLLEQPLALRARFLFGAGLGYRLRYREPAFVVPEEGADSLERLLSPADRPAFRQGLEAPRDAIGPG